MPDRRDHPSFHNVAAAWEREFPDDALDLFVLSAALMRIGQTIERDLFDQARRLFGITGGEILLLFALRRQGAPYIARPRTLTRMLLITSGAVTKQIDRLETKGLVRRSPDTDSLNGQLVSLTDAGLALAERAVRHLADHSIGCEAAARLPVQKVRAGSGFAQALLDEFEAIEAGDTPGPVAARPAAAPPLQPSAGRRLRRGGTRRTA